MALCSVLGMESVQSGGLSTRTGRADGLVGSMGVLDCTDGSCLMCMLSSVGVSAIVARSGDHEQGAWF
jgi:hypothetical protein